jgi:23S rRNA-intervening sequence protein
MNGYRGCAPGENIFFKVPESAKQEPAVAVLKAYDFVLWLLPKVEKFPRSYRFSVGDRLVTVGLDLLLGLVRASYTSDKAALLQNASMETNTLRYLLRLAKDLRILTVDAYGFSTERVEEIGRMIGGWQKSVAKRA